MPNDAGCPAGQAVTVFGCLFIRHFPHDSKYFFAVRPAKGTKFYADLRSSRRAGLSISTAQIARGLVVFTPIGRLSAAEEGL